MKYKSIIIVVIFILLTTIFAMSDDGGNEPKVVKQEVTTSENSVQAEQTEQAKSNETVKDRLGFETGMTKEEVKKFKKDYMSLKAKLLPNSRTDMLYTYKVDLNKYEELKKLGVDLQKSGGYSEAKTYKENAIYNDIIIIGTTLKSERMDNANTFILQIEEIIKGREILKDKFGVIPEYINYYDDTDVAGRTVPLLNIKGIYYLWDTKMISKNRRWIQKSPESTLLITEDGLVVYEKNYTKLKSMKKLLANPKDNVKMQKSEIFRKKIESIYKSAKMYETWKEAVNNLRKILEVNDSENFYNKEFKVEVSE